MTVNPLDQFTIHKVFDLGVVGEHQFIVTNSSMFMLFALTLISFFFILSLRKKSIIPGRLQATAELCYQFISNMLDETTEGTGEKFLPFVFSLFYLILVLNLFGLMPHGFTVTSHIIVTFTLAMMVFLLVTIYAFVKHGKKFIGFFVPKSVPVIMLPLMVMIEIFVYLTRPVSLSIRLAANMCAGHILIFLMTGFIVLMGFWGFLPITFVTLLTGVDLFVAILQAYIFTILSCTYINDAINLH